MRITMRAASSNQPVIQPRQLVLIVALLDGTGVWQLPVMGAVYDATGISDPNVPRAVQRVEAQLLSNDLAVEERDALSRKLLGLMDSPDAPRPERPAPQEKAAAPEKPAEDVAPEETP